MHTCCELGPAPSKSILGVDGRETSVVVARDRRELDGNFDKDHRTNPSNVSFIRETIPLVARLPGWPNYDWRLWKRKSEQWGFPPFQLSWKKHESYHENTHSFRRCFFPFGSLSLLLSCDWHGSGGKLIFSRLSFCRLSACRCARRVHWFRQFLLAALFNHTPRDYSLVPFSM